MQCSTTETKSSNLYGSICLVTCVTGKQTKQYYKLKIHLQQGYFIMFICIVTRVTGKQIK